MALPGMGTIVRFHQGTGVDTPGLVVATPDDWNSEMAMYYGNDGPSSNEVFLVTFTTDTGANLNLVCGAGAGTSVGQFSLIATEVADD